jgi:hypothetical protein
MFLARLSCVSDSHTDLSVKTYKAHSCMHLFHFVADILLPSDQSPDLPA